MVQRLIRVAIYARFSCDKQRDESIDDQVFECKKYCEKMGYVVVAIYPDYALSGRSDDRPQFLRMIEDAKTGLFDVILVWKMDRFARNMQDHFYYEHILNDCGVTIDSVRENIAGTSIEATGNKALSALVAEMQSRKGAEDAMRGMLGKARRCEYLGDSTFGLSHEGNVITLHPTEAPIAAKAHFDLLAGVSIGGIVEWMISEGVKTTRGKDANYNFVYHMLKSMKYAGVYIWGHQKDEYGNKVLDEYGNPVPLVYIEGGIPAIVSMETKLACLKRLTYRKRYKTKANYSLSGKMYCSKCGEPMHGETAHSHSGEEYFYYMCRKKRSACLGTFPKDAVEEAVITSVRRLLKDADTCERLADKFIDFKRKKKSNASIDAVKKELKGIAKQRENILKAVAEGMEYRYVSDKLDALKRQETALQGKIERLKHSASEITKEDLLRFFRALSEGALDDEAIMRAFVSRVWAYEDEVVVVMNFYDTDTSQYEIDAKMKKPEPSGEKVRVKSLWLPG